LSGWSIPETGRWTGRQGAEWPRVPCEMRTALCRLSYSSVAKQMRKTVSDSTAATSGALPENRVTYRFQMECFDIRKTHFETCF